MNAIIRRAPVTRLTGVKSLMDRFFDDPFFGFHGYATPTHKANPMPIDVATEENQVVIRASLPGVKAEDVNVTIEDNRLTIQGESQSDEESENDRYVIRERHSGAFQRSLTLPQGLEGENTDGQFKNGVLTLTIPRIPEDQPKAKTIDVKAG